MASTYTTALLFEKQGTGDNTGTWGTVLNAVLDDVDAAVGGLGSKSVAGSSNVTLSDDEARYAIQKYTGTLTGNIEVRCPARSKRYAVWNATAGSFTLIFKTAAGNGILIPQGTKRFVFCDGTDVFEEAPPVIPGYLSGLGMSQAADADHDVTIAAGSCAGATGDFMLSLDSAMTKQLDVAWAAGTNAGGLFTGAIAAATWYHVFLIRKTADGSIDAGFDTSVSAANIPSGYVAYRRIGSVLTDGSSNLVDFIDDGDTRNWVDTTKDISGAATTGAWTALALRVPPDVRVRAFGALQIGNGNSGEAGHLGLRPTDGNDATPATQSGSSIIAAIIGSSDIVAAPWGPVLTNTSKQIAYYAVGTRLYLATRGYIDKRGA